MPPCGTEHKECPQVFLRQVLPLGSRTVLCGCDSWNPVAPLPQWMEEKGRGPERRRVGFQPPECCKDRLCCKSLSLRQVCYSSNGKLIWSGSSGKFSMCPEPWKTLGSPSLSLLRSPQEGSPRQGRRKTRETDSPFHQ